MKRPGSEWGCWVTGKKKIIWNVENYTVQTPRTLESVRKSNIAVLLYCQSVFMNESSWPKTFLHQPRRLLQNPRDNSTWHATRRRPPDGWHWLCNMHRMTVCFWFLHRVVGKCLNVSQENTASMFRVTELVWLDNEVTLGNTFCR
jgi:hypothetical protein